jgi:hypothetical protein
VLIDGKILSMHTGIFNACALLGNLYLFGQALGVHLTIPKIYVIILSFYPVQQGIIFCKLTIIISSAIILKFWICVFGAMGRVQSNSLGGGQ